MRNSPSVIALNPVLAIVGKTKLVPRPAGTPNYPALSTAIYTNVNAALAGSTSPSAAMAAAQSQANYRPQHYERRALTGPLTPRAGAARIRGPGDQPVRQLRSTWPTGGKPRDKECDQ